MFSYFGSTIINHLGGFYYIYCRIKVSKVRYVVEQVFGILKKHYNFDRCRYGGLEKVNMEFKLVSMAYNLKKAALMVV